MPSASDHLKILLFNESDRDIPLDGDQMVHITEHVEQGEQCTFSMLEVVYVNEDEIVRINSEHLGRNYITDIITFRYDDDSTRQNIEGTIFSCAPRIEEQAREFNQRTSDEYARIFIHGLLHLAGYEDQSPEDKKQMTAREDHYLQLIAGILL